MITELLSRGFDVLAPTNLLRGVEPRTYVASFLTQRTSGPVVLVGHSYGGVVITNAGAAGGDVRALVYVDAFVPDEGETVFQILGGSGLLSMSPIRPPSSTSSAIRTLRRATRPGLPLTSSTGSTRSRRTCQTPTADSCSPVSAQSPCRPTRHQRRRQRGGPSRAGRLSAWQDKVIPAQTQRRMAERAGATIAEVDGSHVSMLSHPQATIDAILAAVAATGQ